jgi:DHA1 family multidrug resistance protein-like MFS transporter
LKSRISPFILLCIIGGLAIFSSTMAKSPVLPLFIRFLNVPMGTVGFIAAASTLVGIVVSLPAGILSDIIGRRRVIIIAAIVFGSAPFLYLLVTQPWHLVLVRIYHGFATAILGPVAMAAVADTFDSGRSEKMGWYSSATMVGRFLAPLVGGALLFGSNFHLVYLVTGIIGTLSLIAALKLPRPTTAHAHVSAGELFKKERGEIKRDIIALLTHRGILTTSVVEAVEYFAFGCLEVFLPIYLYEQVGFKELSIGLLFTIQIVVAALAKPWMGRLSDRYGRVPSIIIGLLLGAVSITMITWSSNYLIMAVLIGLSGLGLATVTASSAALVADLAGESSYGGALGILSSVMDIGHSTGPMAGGLLIATYNYRTTFGVIGGILAVTSLAFGLIMRQISRNKSSPK